MNQSSPLLKIEVRELLSCGGLGRDGSGNVVIFLSDTLSRGDATETLWHEIVHLIKSVNPEASHDEDEIESVARMLAEKCPEALRWCGLHDKFKP